VRVAKYDKDEREEERKRQIIKGEKQIRAHVNAKVIVCKMLPIQLDVNSQQP